MYKYNTLFLNSTYLIRIISPSVHFYLDSEVSVGRFHLECGIEIVLLPGHGRWIVHLTSVGIILSVEVDAHPVVQIVGSALPVHHALADAHVEQGEDGGARRVDGRSAHVGQVGVEPESFGLEGELRCSVGQRGQIAQGWECHVEDEPAEVLHSGAIQADVCFGLSLCGEGSQEEEEYVCDSFHAL